MPELRVIVRWPDDSLMTCYSPSLVIRDYLEVGANYPVSEFLARSRVALTLASERVREKFGFPCVRAEQTLVEIETKAQAFIRNGGGVRVEAYRE